jgi:hypothetical protein
MLPVVIDDDPPPGKVDVVPAVLGAVVLRPPGGVTVVVTPPGVVTVVPPLPRKVEVVGGDKGATDGTRGAGVPIAEGGSAPGVDVPVDGAVVNEPVDLPSDVDGEVALKPEPVAPLPRPPLWAAVSCSDPGTRRPAVATAATHVARRSSMVHLRFRQGPLRSTRLGAILCRYNNHICVRSSGDRARRAAAASRPLIRPFTTPRGLRSLERRGIRQLYRHGGRASRAVRR